MIRHVVVFRWNESVTDEQLVAMSAALDALPAAIAEIVTYRHGRDLGLAPDQLPVLDHRRLRQRRRLRGVPRPP